MTTRSLLFVFLSISCVGAYSQVTDQGSQGNSHQSTQQANANKRGTKSVPLVVEILPTQEDKEKTRRDEQRNNTTQTTNDKIANLTESLATYTLALAFIGFLQLVIIAIQVVLMGRQSEANKIIERAYVTLSHTSPPGLIVEAASGICMVTLQIKNFGSTPAEVIDVCITWRLLPNNESLSDEPDYDLDRNRKILRAFLVTQSEFFHTYSFSIGDNIYPDVESGKLRLWVYGYVDYTDMFGKSHRAGYGRVYLPRETRNNLVFIEKDGYNYDRKRKKGEGNG